MIKVRIFFVCELSIWGLLKFLIQELGRILVTRTLLTYIYLKQP